MNLNPFKGPSFNNPADSGMKYLDQIPGTISPYYQPYVNAGQNSLSTLMNQYNTLLTNPGQTMNMLGSGFQQSPGYQFQMNQGMNAANSAAAAGGMLGTGAHQVNSANIASNLANQDYYNYLNKTLGLYGQGLSGTEGLNQMGYGASNELAQSLAGNLMNQAGMAYSGTQNQNQANADQYGRLMGLIGGIGGIGSGLYNKYF
jgi:hypothetical protein